MRAALALACALALGACDSREQAATSEDPSKLSAQLEARAAQIEARADEAAAAVEREAAEELAELQAEGVGDRDADGQTAPDPASDDAG